jgi:NADPH-dependent 2,4-dienoyl-CoA reductase/sulfur reductase-like enzyme
MVRRIVVVGASLAGLRAAETLRARGYDGALTLIGDEPQRPYDRPPLSKQVLQGTSEPENTFFRRKDGYDALALDMRLGLRATSLDLRAGRITLSGGTDGPPAAFATDAASAPKEGGAHLPTGGPHLPAGGPPMVVEYDRLIVATGARVRTLRGVPPRAGLHVLRGLDDAVALRNDLARARRVAIVGAGFIGLEVAASCRARGLEVTAIEALPVPLAPIVGTSLGELVAAMHRDHGVDLRTGVTVTDMQGEPRVSGVVLSDGSRIEADVVVVGIGVVPNTEWLEGSGLTLDNGIVCDGYGEAAARVYAAGDVARMPNLWSGECVRIEHWTNAVEQAVHVAANMLAEGGDRASFSSVPYFWSDQYDRKVQFVGRARADDEMVIVDGSLADRRLTALYRRGDQVTACLAINQPRALIKYRKLLAEGASWEATLRGTGGESFP